MLNKEGQPIAGFDLATQGGFVGFVPKMMNRHGLISGATGTGKTVTLQSLAETFSHMGAPVFAADMKGDLSGISGIGGSSSSVEKRVTEYRLSEEGFKYQSCPVEFWDPFGSEGHPLRVSVSSMGPLLLERILNLNETQGGVLNIAFHVADDNGLLLIDLNDLQMTLRFLADNAKEISTKYGNVSAASVGAIQRALLRLKSEGGDRFFGMPELDREDLFRTVGGKGVVNIIAADQLSRSPRIYTTFLLWLLSDLFENLPEVGDLDRPKLVFFFDEAHLLFNDTSKALQDKVEQIVRLIRSKGVGIYFVTQTPEDIPEDILGQLGNRVLHALRAYTPKDQKAIKAAADGLRPNPAFDTEETLLSLGTGEAIVSFLDPKGAPGVARKVAILPPMSQIGAIDKAVRNQAIVTSPLHSKYAEEYDPESAFEILTRKYAGIAAAETAQKEAKEAERLRKEEEKRLRDEEKEARRLERERKANKSEAQKILESALGSGLRSVTNSLGRQLIRGALGTLLGKKI